MVSISPIKRRQTANVRVGSRWIGSDHPILVQSMTNTNTADIEATADQVIELAQAGSEIVRMTVNTEDAAKAVPHIRDRVVKAGLDVPLVGCFQINGHKLLESVPACAEALAKYRINPGNVGRGSSRNDNFKAIIEIACRNDKAVRIGVNWGSLDAELKQALMDANTTGRPAEEIEREALVRSAIDSAELARATGMPADRIILSCKVSRVQDLIAVYRDLAGRSSYPLHLGLTEAGGGAKGITATSAALAVLLQEGIGDTIRASLTPRPGEPRDREVILCRDILQAMGLRTFVPTVTSCPGCGRTGSDLFQRLAAEVEGYLADQMPSWRGLYSGVETMNVAVMGCIVNGPGESAHADIAISLPGRQEEPSAKVYIDGKPAQSLTGNTIADEFKTLIADYVKTHYAMK